MKKATITFDEAAITKLLTDPAVGKLVGEAATRAKAIAQASGHRGFMGYSRGFVSSVPRLEGDVWRANVGNDSPGWHLVEFGTRTTPAYRVLSRAVQEAGAKFLPK